MLPWWLGWLVLGLVAGSFALLVLYALYIIVATIIDSIRAGRWTGGGPR